MKRTTERLAKWGARGGKTKGSPKRRSADHYQRIALLGVAARAAKKAQSLGQQ